MKRKTIAMTLAGVLLLSALAVATLADYTASGQAKSRVTTEQLRISLAENPIRIDTPCMPGDQIEKRVQVKNTGDYPLYARITLSKYWTDAAGSKTGAARDADARFLSLISDDQADWISGEEDEQNAETITLYYKKPLAPGESTSDALSRLRVENIPAAAQSLYTQLHIRVDVDAEAIQASLARDAIPDEWGIQVAFGENGLLRQVTE